MLEKLWRLEKGEARDFYHGLIQVAAVFVHLKKGNLAGAKQLLETASRYLAKYDPVYMELNVEKLLAQTHECVMGQKTFPILRSAT